MTKEDGTTLINNTAPPPSVGDTVHLCRNYSYHERTQKKWFAAKITKVGRKYLTVSWGQGNTEGTVRKDQFIAAKDTDLLNFESYFALVKNLEAYQAQRDSTSTKTHRLP